jgi:hypothetical protein
MGKGALATLFPVPRILNIRFGTLEDFDIRFFKNEERNLQSGHFGISRKKREPLLILPSPANLKNRYPISRFRKPTRPSRP